MNINTVVKSGTFATLIALVSFGCEGVDYQLEGEALAEDRSALSAVETPQIDRQVMLDDIQHNRAAVAIEDNLPEPYDVVDETFNAKAPEGWQDGGSSKTYTHDKVSIGNENYNYGRLQVNQTLNNDEAGIAVMNPAGNRTLRLWADNNKLSRIDSGDNGGGKLAINGTNNGKVGIGLNNPDRITHLLTVDGTIKAEKIIVDTVQADYVFDNQFDLWTLDEVETFIDKNGHLPGVPSAKEVDERGVSLGDSHTMLLQKVEELTLHLIDQNKQMQRQQNRITELESLVLKSNL